MFVAFCIFSCADDELVDPEFKIVQLMASSGFTIEVTVRIDVRGSVEPQEVGVYANSQGGDPGFEVQTNLQAVTNTFEDYQGIVSVTAPGTYFVRPFIKDANGKIYEGEEMEIHTGSVSITDYSPKTAGAGARITITGSNFSQGREGPEVYIGELSARVLSFSESTILALVPPGIVAAPVKVVVKAFGKEVIADGELKWLKGLWTRKQNYPGSTLTEGSISFTIGISGYVGIDGRDGNTIDNRIWQYNTVSDKWNESNTFPGSTFGGGRAFQFSNEIPVYINWSNQVWWYVSATNSWIERPLFPPTGVSSKLSFAFSIGSEGFVCKRYQDGLELKIGVWKKELTDVSWTQIGDFPPTSNIPELSLVVDGKAYLFGGSYSLNGSPLPSSQVWQYDLLLDQWTQLADGPFESRYSPAGFVIDNKIYVGGGISESNFGLKDFFEFIPSTGQWERVADVPTGGRLVSFGVHNKGYVVTGAVVDRFEIE